MIKEKEEENGLGYICLKELEKDLVEAVNKNNKEKLLFVLKMVFTVVYSDFTASKEIIKEFFETNIGLMMMEFLEFNEYKTNLKIVHESLSYVNKNIKCCTY